jgi:hypothetical protein
MFRGCKGVIAKREATQEPQSSSQLLDRHGG